MEKKFVGYLTVFMVTFVLTFGGVLCIRPAFAEDLAAGELVTPAQTDILAEPAVDASKVKKAKKLLKECKKVRNEVKACERTMQLDKAKKSKKKFAKPYKKLHLMAKADGYLKYYKKAKKFKKAIAKSMSTIYKKLKAQRSKANSLRFNGVVYSGGWRYTWYSQNELAGGGLSIPGRHVGNAGLIMDKDNYVCLASDSHGRGRILSTPYGLGKVYDCGPGYGTIDVYTNW